MKIWTEGTRKVVGAATATILVTFAYYYRSPPPAFSEYANAIEWILGIFITGHVAQQIGLAKFPAAAARPGAIVPSSRP